MGLFSRRIETAYSDTKALDAPTAVVSPWQPDGVLERITIDELLHQEIEAGTLSGIPITRDMALRIPAVKKAHRIHCTMFAKAPFFERAERSDGQPGALSDPQPAWLTASGSGVSAFHRKYGIASDLFFEGWALVAWNADRTDCVHVPRSMWKVSAQDGSMIELDARVDSRYRSAVTIIPLGYGENGVLVDGIDTLRAARMIEAAYLDRLENPTPLTVLNIPHDKWAVMTKEERAEVRRKYVEGRRSKDGAVVVKSADFPIDFPGVGGSVDLFESGRNANRLDVANATSTPASLLEGVRQGGSGGGTEIRYSGVANGESRAELWDFGMAGLMVAAFESRMSMDDVTGPGKTIRADLTAAVSTTTPTTNPTSEG